MNYFDIANKAEYIADVARNIAVDFSEFSATEEAQVAAIFRQLQNIADSLDEIAPCFQSEDD